jgi:hypothetical protein
MECLEIELWLLYIKCYCPWFKCYLKFIGFVMNVLCDIFKHVGIFVKKEASVNFSTNLQKGILMLRFANILVYGWIWGYICLCGFDWNLSTCGIEDGRFYCGQTSFKVASSKIVKYEKTCSDNQYAFITSMFDTFGFLSHMLLIFWKELKWSDITKLSLLCLWNYYPKSLVIAI